MRTDARVVVVSPTSRSGLFSFRDVWQGERAEKMSLPRPRESQRIPISLSLGTPHCEYYRVGCHTRGSRVTPIGVVSSLPCSAQTSAISHVFSTATLFFFRCDQAPLAGGTLDGSGLSSREGRLVYIKHLRCWSRLIRASTFWLNVIHESSLMVRGQITRICMSESP